MKTKKSWMCGVLLGLGCLVVLTAPLSAQVAGGKRFEFSTSASLWNVAYENEESHTTLNLPLRLGFYAYKGLEFEPELFLTIPDETDATGIMAFGNVAYNFQFSPKFLGFLLGGVGIGNGSQFWSMIIDQDTSIVAFNFGGGVKAMIGNSAALRLEYRYISYSEEGNHFRTDQNILAGVSIFF